MMPPKRANKALQIQRPPGQGVSKKAKARRRKKTMTRYSPNIVSGAAPGVVAIAPGRALATQRVRKSVRYGGAVTNASRRAMMYAVAITMPHESPAMRLPTVDVPRTSVGTFMDQYTISSTTGAQYGFNAGDLLFAFFGQPNRLAMMSKSIPAGQISRYEMIFTNSGGAGTAGSWSVPVNYGSSGAGVTQTYSLSADWPLVSGSYDTGSNVELHGVSFPVGLSQGKRYLWADAGVTFSFTVTLPASVASGTLFINLSFWSQETSSDQQQVAVGLSGTGGSAVFTAPFSGYWVATAADLVITNTAGGSGNITIGVVWNASGPLQVMSTIHMGDLDQYSNGDSTMGRKCRVNAATMLLTNTTAMIQKQGTVLAARLNEVPFFQVTPNILARAAEKYTGMAETGLYTYKEFTVYSETFRQNIDNTYPVFDLDYADYYHFVQVSSTSYVSSPNTFTLSFNTTLEFQSDISRHPKDVANAVENQALIAARGIIASSPEWFFENPMHWADVLGLIKRGASSIYGGAKTYGPTLMRGASAAFPMYSPLFSATRGLLEALP